RTFAKYLLRFLGYIYCCSAATLALGGVSVTLMYRNYRYLFQKTFLFLPGWLTVGAAIILLPTGLLAISLSAKSTRYKQGFLMYLLLVLLCLEMSSAVLAQFYSLQTPSELKSTMGYLVYQYSGTASKDPGVTVVDMVQRRLQCCGVQNYTDWLKTTDPSWHLLAGSTHVPESCCKEKYSDCMGDLNNLDQIFQEGCLKKLEHWFQFLTLYVFWHCVVLSVLGLLTIVINGFLMRHQRFPNLQFL
ncbi:TSN3 protein, partial [Psilopogon haemacephalus]|nr:TSN3 protein [Psilopogon haemacephalus]